MCTYNDFMNWSSGEIWCILSYGWDKHQKIDHYFPFLKIEKLPVLRAGLDWWNPFPPTFMIAITDDILWVFIIKFMLIWHIHWINTLLFLLWKKNCTNDFESIHFSSSGKILLTSSLDLQNVFTLYYRMIKWLIEINCDLLLIFQTIAVVLCNSYSRMCCHYVVKIFLLSMHSIALL